VNVPVPVLASEPLLLITPEKVVLVLLLPTVRLFAPRNTFPLPSSEPMATPPGL